MPFELLEPAEQRFEPLTPLVARVGERARCFRLELGQLGHRTIETERIAGRLVLEPLERVRVRERERELFEELIQQRKARDGVAYGVMTHHDEHSLAARAVVESARLDHAEGKQGTRA